MSVVFKDNSMAVKAALDSAIRAFLHEAGGEMTSQVQSRSRVDSGQLKGSWQYKVTSSGTQSVATVGSPLENAIWEEFGTGEYALHGDGRKGGWYVPAENLSGKAKSRMQKRTIKGKEYYFTRGKTPSRAFYNSYTATKPKIIKLADRVIGAKMK